MQPKALLLMDFEREWTDKNSEYFVGDISGVLKRTKMTNLCVRSAVQDAYDRDFKIKVIKDCCVSIDRESQDFTFKNLKATREEVEFLDLEEFLE